MIEPVDPFQRGVFDDIDIAPAAAKTCGGLPTTSGTRLVEKTCAAASPLNTAALTNRIDIGTRGIAVIVPFQCRSPRNLTSLSGRPYSRPISSREAAASRN